MKQNCSPQPTCIAVVNSSATMPDIVAGIMTIPGLPNIEFGQIRRVAITCASVETQALAELTPQAFERGDCCDETDEYYFDIAIPSCDSENLEHVFRLPLTKDRTATQIVDAFVEQVNNNVAIGAYITASNNSGKLRLEANTNGINFSVPDYSSNFTTVTQQGAQQAFGQDETVIAELAAANITATVTDAETYTAYDIFYFVPVNPGDLDQRCCGDCYMWCERWCRLYVEDASDTETFVTELCAILGGTHSPTADYLSKITSCDCVDLVAACPDVSFSYAYGSSGDSVTVTNTTATNPDTIASVSIVVTDEADATVTATAFGAINVAALDAGDIQTIDVTITYDSGCVVSATATTGGIASGNPSGTGT